MFTFTDFLILGTVVYVLMGLVQVLEMILVTRLKVKTWAEVLGCIILALVWPKWFDWNRS